LRDALRLWEACRELHQRDIELLRQRWNEGKASGIAGLFDIERFIAKGKAPSSD
jgi:antitoxin ParD1/3/4